MTTPTEATLSTDTAPETLFELVQAFYQAFDPEHVQLQNSRRLLLCAVERDRQLPARERQLAVERALLAEVDRKISAHKLSH